MTLAPPSPHYCGRFAPSPTGPLHLGSLLTAVGSYLQARAQGGRWLVRMEDLDPPRELPGASAQILTALEAHGMEWDGPVLYQSQRLDAYQQALERLIGSEQCYPCICSRREVEDHQQRHQLPAGVYPGLCRHRPMTRGDISAKIRVRIAEQHLIHFDDPIQGYQQSQLARSSGDFVIRRADGLFAYQLAVVIDDSYQGVTEVVRGSDLLDSTPNQIYLQQLLGLPSPAYMHLPVLIHSTGEKLSKQTFAQPLDTATAQQSLQRVFQFLGLPTDRSMHGATCHELLQWAVARWDHNQIPHKKSLVLPKESPEWVIE